MVNGTRLISQRKIIMATDFLFRFSLAAGKSMNIYEGGRERGGLDGIGGMFGNCLPTTKETFPIK